MHADELCCAGTDPIETSFGSGPATKPEPFRDPLLDPHRNGSGTDPLQSRSRNGPVSEPNMDALRDSKRIRFGSQETQKGFKKGPRKMHPAGHGMGSNRIRIGSPRRARWLPAGSLFDSIQDPFPFRWSSQLAPFWIPFGSFSVPIQIHFTLFGSTLRSIS